VPSWSETLKGGTNQETDQDGEAWFVLPRGTVVDVEVLAKGFATRKVVAARFPLDVTVGPGTTIAFAFAGHQALEPHVRSLVVVADDHQNGPHELPFHTIGRLIQVRHPLSPVDFATGTARLPNLPPGTYRLWLCAHAPIRQAAGPPVRAVLLGDVTADSITLAELPFAHTLTAAQIDILAGR
jgi:hypothetical protein